MKKVYSAWIVFERDDESFQIFKTELEARAEAFEDDKNNPKKYEKQNVVEFYCDACGAVLEWGEGWTVALEEHAEEVLESMDEDDNRVQGDVQICADCLDTKKDLDLISNLQLENESLVEKLTYIRDRYPVNSDAESNHALCCIKQLAEDTLKALGKEVKI